MKNILKLIVVAALAFTIPSCDYVNNPIENASPADTGSTGVVHRKVLIEDYTGHKCTACPQAALAAQSILLANPGKVVVIGVHAGFFSTPSSSGSNYLADFRTTTGTAYNTFFGFTQYPSGLVNRKDYTSLTTAHIKPHGSWATETAAELLKPAVAKLEIENTYTSGSRGLSCEVKTTFLYDTLTEGPYKLIVLITQDSIVANQLDNGTLFPNYVHKHVLRDNLSTGGTWGDVISAIPVTKNSAITKTYSYTFPATYPSAGGTSATNCDPNYCAVVAILYNDLTKEVIQVEEKHVTH